MKPQVEDFVGPIDDIAASISHFWIRCDLISHSSPAWLPLKFIGEQALGIHDPGFLAIYLLRLEERIDYCTFVHSHGKESAQCSRTITRRSHFLKLVHTTNYRILLIKVNLNSLLVLTILILDILWNTNLNRFATSRSIADRGFHLHFVNQHIHASMRVTLGNLSMMHDSSFNYIWQLQ